MSAFGALPHMNAAIERYSMVVGRRLLKLSGVEDHGYDEHEHAAAAAVLDEWLAQAVRCMDAVVLAQDHAAPCIDVERRPQAR